MDSLPQWLKTEEDVKRIFILYKFQVENISLSGRQIDLVATRLGQFDIEDEKWIVEITCEKVGVDKGSKDAQKLQLAKKEFPNSRLMIISTGGFTDDQKTSLKNLGIIALTYTEFEGRSLNLKQYAVNALESLKTNTKPDIGYNSSYYVKPTVNVRVGENEFKKIESDKWIEDQLNSPQPSICALLGNLGSGKTSLLQYFQEVGTETFLRDPDNSPLPFYIPLGRYKQHSGNLEQMLMSELQKAGIDLYPSALVRQLIDSRRIILLLDGFDEIHPIQNSGDILETVTTIFNGVGKNASAIISCRRQFFETTQEELAYFGSYTSSHLKDLQSGLSKLLRGNPTSYTTFLEPFDREKVEQYLANRCSMSIQDIDDLFNRFYGFKDLSTTPVLLAMIATTVNEKLLDPKVKIDYPLLFLYEVYTKRWLERDSGRARLNTDQRRKLSETIAEYMLWESKDSASWSNIKEVLRTDSNWGNNPITDEEAELDIRNSGFLVRDLDDSYRFIHRSIMEYFAAKSELEKLQNGSRPRHFPTDGFKTFLIQFISRSMAAEGGVVFQPQTWDTSRGNHVVEAQFSMISAASNELDGKRISLGGILSTTVNTDQVWKNTDFQTVQIRQEGGDLKFVSCTFKNSSILNSHDNKLEFDTCDIKGLRITFQEIPSHTSNKIELSAPQGSLDLLPIIWELCMLVEGGAVITVKNKPWELNYSDLTAVSELMNRMKGKVKKDLFTRELLRRGFKKAFDVFLRKNLILEDGSRQGHQLEMAPKAHEIIGRFRNQPIEAQKELHDIINGKSVVELKKGTPKKRTAHKGKRK